MTRTATAGPLRRVRPRHQERARVDLWLRSVEGAPTDEGVAWLERDERARAEGYRFERDRARFLGRRVFLREVLAGYLGNHPRDVHVRAGARGRPELVGSSDLAFNASHSGGLAVVAVTRGCPVGVDIERLRPIDDALGLARGLFCQREVEALADIPDTTRGDAFLTLWTRKESVLKASGVGLSMQLDEVDVLDVYDGIGRPRGALGALSYTFADFGRHPAFVGAVTLGVTSAPPVVKLVEAA